MSTPAGTYRLGPENGTLAVRTTRSGAVAKAGHDLLIHVTGWEAEVTLAEDPAASAVAVSVDGASLRVREGTGGIKALDDDDVANIHQTIDDEILKRGELTFRSTRVEPADAGRLRVEGDLTILGTTHPLAVDLAVGDDGALSARTVIRQTDWGIKPYSALFGALKVADEVEVEVDARLPTA